MKVVVTRERGVNDSLIELLPPEAIIDEVPLTRTEYFDPEDVRRDLAATDDYGTFLALVVTSERSVRYVDLAFAASSPDVAIYSVGPVTTAALVAHDIYVSRESDGTADTLANHIDVGPVLLLGAKSMRTELASSLRAKGLVVVTVACYETVGVDVLAGDAQRVRDADVVFIGAPSAWSVARALVADATWVVVPGATTAAEVRRDHDRVIEGWGADLRVRLVELSNAPDA